MGVLRVTTTTTIQIDRKQAVLPTKLTRKEKKRKEKKRKSYILFIAFNDVGNGRI